MWKMSHKQHNRIPLMIQNRETQRRGCPVDPDPWLNPFPGFQYQYEHSYDCKQ